MRDEDDDLPTLLAKLNQLYSLAMEDNDGWSNLNELADRAAYDAVFFRIVVRGWPQIAAALKGAETAQELPQQTSPPVNETGDK